MSDYVSKKAIRYKLDVKTEEEKEKIWDKIFDDYNFKNDFNLKHNMEYERGYDDFYLDIPLKKTYGTICGDFGSSRKITNEEVNEYLEDFKKVVPNITKNDLRYVFYCYYNGVDAPDCYDEGEWDYD